MLLLAINVEKGAALEYRGKNVWWGGIFFQDVFILLRIATVLNIIKMLAPKLLYYGYSAISTMQK